MTSELTSIIVTLILFSILVVVHEFGHFIVAKKNGILVEEFALGMGPLLLSKQWGETLYSLRLFPIGGFCRMLGEDEDCFEDRSFQSKGVFARICVVAAGPIMNFLLAMVFLFALSSATYIEKPEVQAVLADSPAEAAGLQEGDKITKLNGKRVYVFDDFRFGMMTADGSPMEVEVLRDGQKLTFEVAPKFSEEQGQYIFGYTPMVLNGLFAEEVEGYDRAGVWETITASFHDMVFYVRQTAMGLAKMFTFNVSRDEVAGPIGIFQIVGDSYQAGIQYSVKAALLNLAHLGALLSANLGVLNLFPIPALDGGRIVFLVIEAIRHKRINPETEGKVNYAGFMLLILFMILVAFNDVVRIFVG